MDNIYAGSSLYIGVIIVLGVLVAGLALALLMVLRKRKAQPQHYPESAINRIEEPGALGEGIGSAETGRPRNIEGGERIEKAVPVAPYTNWDKTGLNESRTEASFGGFVEDEEPAEPKEETSQTEASAGIAQPGVPEREQGHPAPGLSPEQALLLFKSHELLLTLTDGFKKLVSAKTEEARKEKLAEMQEAMKLLDAKNEWEQYRACFNRLYPGFWPKVEAAAGEEMSPYELRLCALLSLGMGTKELADLTNRSVRTVETSIYKIRKKLGMGSEEKTTDFLRRFL